MSESQSLPSASGQTLLRDIAIAMRDGVHLATDVYLPAHAKGPLPVILERTPYGKHKPSRSELLAGQTAPMARAELARHFTDAGYAIVFQDCRGRYGSQGDFTKYLSEGPDGFDTIEWIAKQEWCNGKVGMMGLSYAAHTQMAAACLNPPALVCMILDSGGFSNAFTCGIRQGGAFELKQATWAWNHAKESRKAEQDPALRAALEAENIFAWFKAMPWSKGQSPIRWDPDYEDYLLEQWRHGTFDAYWQKIGIYAEGSYDTLPLMPVALMSSWYDAYVKTTLDNFAGLSRAQRPLQLIMGPWTHGDRTKRVMGDVDFGPQALFEGHVAKDWLAYRLTWFNHHLKHEPITEDPRVRLFLMGGGSGARSTDGKLDHGGQWIAGSDWPLPGTIFEDWYIESNGRLSKDKPAPSAAALSFSFDPRHPVPTLGGALTSGQPVFVGGAFDQREDARFFGCTDIGLPLSARRDVLSFETEPLSEDLALIGPIQIELWVTSDQADTDFTAKLMDIYPPSADWPLGFAMNLTDGIFRCRYRKSFAKPEPIQSGEIFKIVIEPFATANLFKAGHRIRLDISSSNFPKYDVNPNSYEPEGEGRLPRVAINTVFMDAQHPSRLILPVHDVALLKTWNMKT